MNAKPDDGKFKKSLSILTHGTPANAVSVLCIYYHKISPLFKKPPPRFLYGSLSHPSLDGTSNSCQGQGKYPLLCSVLFSSKIRSLILLFIRNKKHSMSVNGNPATFC